MKVFVTGSFDELNSRHIRFLDVASNLGPVTVLLWPDEAVRRKFGQPPKFPETERLYLLRAIRYVTEVKLQSSISDDALGEFPGEPALWAVEAAHDTPARRAFCKAHGLEYRVVSDAAMAALKTAEFQSPEAGGRKRVMVTGCFDWFHSGHVRFFEEASTHGDLYVVVGHDANIRLLKGEGRPLFPQEQRRYVVGSIRFVKQAVISTGNGWLDAEPEIQLIRPDIYVVNEDGDVPEKREYCRGHGIEYLVLKRTPAPGLPKRSSTELRGF